jgi:hypothetical protein
MSGKPTSLSYELTPVGAAQPPPPSPTLDAGQGCPAPQAFDPPPTCADATQKTTPIVAQSSLKIALKDPKFDPLTEVVVKIGSKKVADVKGVKKIKKGITIKKLPSSGTYKVSVVATTILKQKLTGSQTYKACAKGSGKIKLKGKKGH